MTDPEECKEQYRERIKGKINWRSWKEKPADGEEIWILDWHIKGHFPSSFSIYAGEVVYSSREDKWCVCTNDYNGGGSETYYPGEYGDGFICWAEKWEIPIPEHLISWDHDPFKEKLKSGKGKKILKTSHKPLLDGIDPPKGKFPDYRTVEGKLKN